MYQLCRVSVAGSDGLDAGETESKATISVLTLLYAEPAANSEH